MQYTAQVLFCFIQVAVIVFGNLLFQNSFKSLYDTPDTVQETEGAFNALVAPLQLSFRRSSEENEQTRGIGTVFGKDFFRRNNVAPEIYSS